MNVLVGHLSKIPWWPGPQDLGGVDLRWYGLESLLNHHLYMELLGSLRHMGGYFAGSSRLQLDGQEQRRKGRQL